MCYSSLPAIPFPVSTFTGLVRIEAEDHMLDRRIVLQEQLEHFRTKRAGADAHNVPQAIGVESHTVGLAFDDFSFRRVVILARLEKPLDFFENEPKRT